MFSGFWKHSPGVPGDALGTGRHDKDWHLSGDEQLGRRAPRGRGLPRLHAEAEWGPEEIKASLQVALTHLVANFQRMAIYSASLYIYAMQVLPAGEHNQVLCSWAGNRTTSGLEFET